MGLGVSTLSDFLPILSKIATNNDHLTETIGKILSGTLPLDALLVIGVENYLSELGRLSSGILEDELSPHTLIGLMVIATLSYCSPKDELLQEIKKYGIEVELYLDGGAAQVLLFHLDAINTTIVSFRGTQAPDFSSLDPFHSLDQFILDWLTNFDSELASSDDGGAPSDASTCLVHRGFKSAVDELWSDGLQDFLKNSQDRQLLLVGHSQGAGLALLAAWKIATELPIIATRVKRVVAMASPLVGNDVFVRTYDHHGVASKFKTLRLYNELDPILFAQVKPHYALGPGASRHFWRHGQPPKWQPQVCGDWKETLALIVKQSTQAGYATVFDHFPAGPDFVILGLWPYLSQPGYLATLKSGVGQESATFHSVPLIRKRRVRYPLKRPMPGASSASSDGIDTADVISTTMETLVDSSTSTTVNPCHLL